MARILIPLPDRDFDVTEVAVPWKLLTRAGHEVVFATEAGATPAADPLLLSGVIFGALGAEPEAKAFYADLERAPGFARPRRWADLDPDDFAALFLPGGHAPGMRQYLGSAELQAKVAGFWATGRPVAAICHGPLVLARAVDPATGRSLLHGKKTTCLPRYMERTAFYLTAWRRGRYYRTYPAYVEDEVRGALASAEDFVRGPRVLTRRGTDGDDRAAFTVRDGAYLSARWPGDSYKIAKELIAGLVVLVVLLWGALASARTRLNMPAGWTWPPSAAMAGRGRACLAHLDALGVRWRHAPPRRKVTTPIYLDDMTVAGVALVPTAKKGPFVMDCLLAATLADTAAVLRSAGVAELRFAEIWDYRNINDGRRPILSRHALGLAVDVFALVTDDGVRHVVETDYPDAFLLTVEDWLRATGSYRILTPGNDPRHHHDHFHLEVQVDYRPRSLAALAP